MAKVRIRRQSGAKVKKPRGLPPPGCMVLPEDKGVAHTRLSLKAQPMREAAPRIREAREFHALMSRAAY